MNKRKIPILLHVGMAAAGLADEPARSGRLLSDDFWKDEQGQEIAHSMEKALRGIQKYVTADVPPREHPKIIWREGETSLRVYRSSVPQTRARILIMPSLINGYEIVDLYKDRSFAQYMASQGFDVLIIDWGDLKQDADLCDFNSIITKRVRSIFDFIKTDNDLPIMGVGYCMGGILLAASDILYPDFFAALSFIATPWDFHQHVQGNFAEHLLNWAKDGLPKIKTIDYVPADWLQMIFMGVDPSQIARKFSAFDDMNIDEDKARIFIEVENWLNGGADIPSPLLIESVTKWYVNNEIYKGVWEIGGYKIDARSITKPCHVTIPQKDRIVPPSSAEAICQQLSKVSILKADTGHISLMMGREAKHILWDPLCDFFMMHCGR